tara:strand:+ start:669 stop:881 length:213 start_codon:yes stop_codon:yes gene_type:complete
MKIGDMVKVSYIVEKSEGKKFFGTIVDIEEVTDLFSEKYAITEVTTYVRVLVDGEVKTFTADEDYIEVIK